MNVSSMIRKIISTKVNQINKMFEMFIEFPSSSYFRLSVYLNIYWLNGRTKKRNESFPCVKSFITFGSYNFAHLFSTMKWNIQSILHTFLYEHSYAENFTSLAFPFAFYFCVSVFRWTENDLTPSFISPHIFFSLLLRLLSITTFNFHMLVNIEQFSSIFMFLIMSFVSFFFLSIPFYFFALKQNNNNKKLYTFACRNFHFMLFHGVRTKRRSGIFRCTENNQIPTPHK